MKATNRVTKSISQYVASKDDLRPSMQGIAANGRSLLATNGHLLIYGETPEDEQPRFSKPGIYRIDEQQNITASFFEEPHEIINEPYPDAAKVLPNKEDYVYHSVGMTVENLYNFVRLLKKLNFDRVRLHFPEDRNKAVIFETDDEYNDNLKRLVGLIMPAMLNHYKDNKEEQEPGSNPFNDELIQKIRHLVNTVNDTEEKKELQPA